jgi:hypothetical protein
MLRAAVAGSPRRIAQVRVRLGWITWPVSLAQLRSRDRGASGAAATSTESRSACSARSRPSAVRSSVSSALTRTSPAELVDQLEYADHKDAGEGHDREADPQQQPLPGQRTTPPRRRLRRRLVVEEARLHTGRYVVRQARTCIHTQRSPVLHTIITPSRLPDGPGELSEGQQRCVRAAMNWPSTSVVATPYPRPFPRSR